MSAPNLKSQLAGKSIVSKADLHGMEMLIKAQRNLIDSLEDLLFFERKENSVAVDRIEIRAERDRTAVSDAEEMLRIMRKG